MKVTLQKTPPQKVATGASEMIPDVLYLDRDGDPCLKTLSGVLVVLLNRRTGRAETYSQPGDLVNGPFTPVPSSDSVVLTNQPTGG